MDTLEWVAFIAAMLVVITLMGIGANLIGR